MLVTCSIEQGAGQTQTIGSIDGTARLREFVATAREKGLRVTTTAWPILVHSLRTGIACVVSLLVARLFRLPEAYWAPMSTLIVMQSTLDAALPIAMQYFAGAAVGAVVGAVIDTYFHGNFWAFGAAVFAIGLVAVAFHIERSVFRHASITLAIVMLVPRSTSARLVALHRFFEVSIGVTVGLVLLDLRRRIGWRQQA